MPHPVGFWGLALPDLGAAGDKTQARQLLTSAGYTASNQLRVEIVTRNLAIYRDMAAFVPNELKQDHGVDDSDSNFLEHYICRSTRNCTGYCDEETEKLIEQQSPELDPKKRLALVQRIQKKLEDDAARPMLAWRYDDKAHWPHVKNLIPRHTIYSYGRMQEPWLDR